MPGMCGIPAQPSRGVRVTAWLGQHCASRLYRRLHHRALAFGDLLLSFNTIHSYERLRLDMAFNRRFALSVAVIAVFAIFTGCGGGGNSLSFPPPQGTFTNASLTGPFAFSYTGSDGRGFLAVAGSFQADGAGHVTSGMEDINSGFGISTNAAITGTYSVRADGRGSANLNSPAGNSVIDFVIVAAGHALITRFDANATGSGTIDQQTASAFNNAALAGTFAFNLSGIDSLSNPLAVAGNFTADASGTITSGVDEDRKS